MAKPVKKQKKSPSDYPVFGFRVPEDRETGESPAKVKQRLYGLIERAERHLSGETLPGGYAWNRNRIIVRALEIGLERLAAKRR